MKPTHILITLCLLCLLLLPAAAAADAVTYSGKTYTTYDQIYASTTLSSSEKLQLVQTMAGWTPELEAYMEWKNSGGLEAYQAAVSGGNSTSSDYGWDEAPGDGLGDGGTNIEPEYSYQERQAYDAAYAAYQAEFAENYAATAAYTGSGSGTQADPYQITTAAELQSMNNDLSAHYKLMNNINFNGVSVTWTPIGTSSAGFHGTFDGNGKTISNLVISSTTQNTAFFGSLTSGATIKDVTFQDCSVTSTSTYCGVIIGSIIMSSSAHDTAVISNVDCVRCSASTSARYVGCLVGSISTSAVVKITDCDVSYSEAESTSSSHVGCLVGMCYDASSTEITRCNVLYSHARASKDTVGCLVGVCDRSSSLVIDSSTAQNSISESASSSHVGCLVGVCYGASSVNALNCDVVNCIAKGTNYVGGIVGMCDISGSVVTAQACTISGCTIVAISNYAGGVTGRCVRGTTGIFSGCSVTDSTIIASGYAAGVCPAFS